MSSGEYEVYALRYYSQDWWKSSAYYRFDLYGEPDEPCPMDYFFWLVRDPERTVLVDCGFSARCSAEKDRPYRAEPLELLSRFGVAPDDVDH